MTESTAMAATVMAVPSPMTKVATTPAQNSPCASVNTSTRIAPEHGRKPTATIARQPALPAAGTGQLLRLRRVRMAPGRSMVVIAMRVIMAMRVLGMVMMRVIVVRVRGMIVVMIMVRDDRGCAWP